MAEQEFTIKRRDGETKVRLEPVGLGKHKVTVQRTTAIPRTFLDARAEERKRGGRAPLGDDGLAMQKVAEVPLAWLFAKLPPDAWEDQNKLRKLLNDPEFRFFRSDGDHRKF